MWQTPLIPDTAPIDSMGDLMKAYPHQFNCIGHFLRKYHIVVDSGVMLAIHVPRKCRIHMKDEVKKEVEKMVSDKVKRKVDEPTD